MRKRFVLLTAVFMACVSARPAMGAHQGVGAVSPGIDYHAGSTMMAAPITVPPGRGGIQPDIRLRYSSGLPNGLLGVGWLLELGSIERSTKRGVPKYNGTDVFVLRQTGSAQELVNIGEERFASRFEGAFMKMEFVAGRYWRVTDKNGVMYYFGEDPASREYDPADSDRVFKWCLNRVEDLHGNYMTADYFREGNRLYPQRVVYTGNAQTGDLPFASVEFVYEPREDVPVSYIAGFKRSVMKRIVTIDVKAQGHLQRRYALGYTRSGITNRSLLASVTQYGSDGQTALPPVSLAYQDGADPAYTVRYFSNAAAGNNRWNVRWAGGYDRGHDNYGPVPPGNFDVNWGGPSTAASGSNGTITWNVNGNGHLYFSANSDSAYWMWTYLYTDSAKTLSVPYSSGGVVGAWLNNNYSNVGQTWHLNEGYNLVEITAYHQHSGFDFNLNSQLANEVDVMGSGQVSFPALFSGDFNGDGLADAADFDVSSGKIDVMLSEGTTLAAGRTWISNFGAGRELISGDFNGDGKTDIGGFDKAGGDWRVALSDGERFNDAGSWIAGFGKNRRPVTGDFNGDGLTDIASVFEQSGQCLAGIALNEGGRFGVWTARNFSVGAAGGAPFAADFNADGLADLGAFHKSTGAWDIALNRGIPDLDFEPLSTVTGVGSDKNFLVADSNADGLADIGYYDYSTGRIHLVVSEGAAFTTARQLPFQHRFRASTAQVQSADYNGDGLADFMARNAMGDFEIAFSGGLFSDLLSSVNNGIGGVTSIEYKPSTDWDNPSLPFSIPVVKSVTVSDSRGNSYTTAYEYGGGMWDGAQREFRGFKRLKQVDAEGNYSETEYLQDDVFQGRIAQRRGYDSSGNLFDKAVNTWDAQEVYPGARFVYLKRKDHFVYDGAGRRTAEEFFYEENPQTGNLTKTVHLGEVNLDTGADIGSDARTVETAYVHNDDRHILGLPGLTVVKDAAGNEVRKTWFDYDGTDNGGMPTLGLLTRKKDWAGDAPGAVHPATTYAYDDFGNLVATTDPLGNTTTIAYDASWGIFPVTATNALGHAVVNEYYGVEGVPLDDGGGHAGLWGQLKSTTDPNQQTGQRVYNALGDLVAVVSPLDSIDFPTMITDIEFGGDHVRVTTRRRIRHGQPATVDTVSFTDGLGRVLQTKSESGTAGQYIVSGQTEYDSRGLPVRQYLAYFSQNPPDTIDPVDTGRPHTAVEYDAAGRVTRTTNPDGTYSTIAYNDRATVTIDENGHKRESVFDAYGRLVEKREYTGADGRSPHYPSKPYTLYAKTLYFYDSEGNLTRTEDAHGNTTTITYDPLGRKVAMDDPDMGAWRYEYDLNGNLIRQTDAKGQTIDFTYDALNRLANKTDGGAVNVDYTYDDDAVDYSRGRLTEARYAGEDTAFRYDPIGREIESIKKINSRDYGVGRGYDAFNNLLDIRYPDEEKVFYRYNDAGQIDGVSNDESLFIGPQSMTVKQSQLQLSLRVPPAAGRSDLKTGLFRRDSASSRNDSALRGTRDALRDTITHFYTNWFEPHVLGIKEAYAEQVPADYTTFTEADAADNITVTPQCIAFEDIETRTTSSFVYKAQASAGDFIYEFDAILISSDTFSGETAVWGVSNTANDTFDDWNDGAIVAFYKSGSTVYLKLKNMDSGVTDASSPLSLNRRYYVRVSRAGSVVAAEIYGDAQRTNLIDTLTKTIGADTYAYLYGFSVRDYIGTNKKASGDVCRLSVGEGQGAGDTEAPVAPADLNLTGFTENAMDLAWTASTDNVGVAGYRLDVAADGSFSNRVGGYDNKDLGNVTSTTITGLAADTEYYVRLRAYDAAGNVSANSAGASGSTQPPSDVEPPAAPAGLVLSNPTAGTLDLAWTVSVDNVGVAGYRLDVATDGSFTHKVSGYDNKDLGNVISTTITGLGPGTEYYVRLRAYDAAGNVSADSETASLGTEEPPPPSPGGSLDYTSFTETDEHNTVDVSPACVAFTHLESRASEAYVYKAHAASGDFTYEFDAMVASGDLFAGETVVWGVSNTAGATYDRWEDGAIVSFYKGGSAGLRLELEDVSTGFADNSITLSPGRRYYVRVRRAGSVLTAEIYSDARRTVPVDTLRRNFNADAYAYVYGFSAESGTSTGHKITGDVCNLFDGERDVEAPQPPASLTAAAVSESRIDLAWNASTDNTGVAGYRVYRDGAEVGTTPATAYADTGLLPETGYTYTVSAYDAEGNESPPSAPAGATTLSAPAGPQLFVKDVEYNAHGQVTRVEYGSGTVTTNTYNPLNLRLERIQTVNSLGEVLQDLTYTYDAAGSVLSITDNVNTSNQTFKYDELNRLVEAVGETYGTRTYAYDEIGNIVEKDGKFYSYGEGGAGPHAVTSLSDGTTFTYDANGNMVTRQGPDLALTQYTYDAENRLIKVEKDGRILSEFEYDGDGGRTRKIAGGAATEFVGSLFEKQGRDETKYVFLGGTRVASVTNGRVFYYHGDHLGGANVLTDADGAVKEIIEYSPFGEYSRRDKYGTDEELARFYFTGQRRDDETGLYYYGTRYYDPSIGRFITPDTVVPYPSNPQAFNRYTYAGNNPVSYLEDGNGWFIPFIIAAIKGAAIGAAVGAATAAVTGGDIGKGALFGAIGGAAFAGVASGVTSLAKFALTGTTNVSLIGNTATTLSIISGTVGGAAAGAGVAGAAGGDIGLGALAGTAGAVAGFLGSYNLAPSAGHVLGSVAAAAVTREDLGRAAYLGFLDSSVSTTIEFMIPQPTIGQQGTPEGGDLIFYKGGLDPSGLFLSYLQGAPISHVATAINGKYQVDSHINGGVNIRGIDFGRQGRIVKWAGTGNKGFIDLAVQYGKTNAFKYWLGPGREVCSTFCGRVATETGLSIPGFSPASQYYNIQNIPSFSAYGVQRP